MIQTRLEDKADLAPQVSNFQRYILDNWNVTAFNAEPEAGCIKYTIVRVFEAINYPNNDEMISELGILSDYLRNIATMIHDPTLAQYRVRYVFVFPRDKVPKIEDLLFEMEFYKELEEVLSE